MQVGRDLRKCFRRFEVAGLVLGRCLGDSGWMLPAKKVFHPPSPQDPNCPRLVTTKRLWTLCGHKIPFIKHTLKIRNMLEAKL